MEGYCVRCKAKKEMADAVETRTSRGQIAVMGRCITCGTRMFKIGVPIAKPEK